MKEYEEKCIALRTSIEQLAAKDMVVAFSGGADSSLLLKLACEAAGRNGRKVYAVTVHTRLHPAGDLEAAERTARETGAIHRILFADELEEAGIRNNPTDRCYRCKKCLFQKIRREAESLGTDVILEGTNEDDLHVYRPGIRALGELGILSPLAQAGLTKAEVRRLAGEYGLSAANRPAAPCLATRFPYGARLSYETMEKINQAEEYIRGLGFYNVRIRLHGAIARIEVDSRDMDRLFAERQNLTEYMKDMGFVYVTRDMEGFRSGRMDVGIVQ